MPTLIEASKDRRQLNSIKSKFSVAYLHGLNAAVNFAMQEAGRDYDGLGIDFQITNKVVGPGRSVSSEANEINIQLKAVSVSSSSMLHETSSTIEYRLNKDFHPVGTHYLIVVVLPKVDDIDSWCDVTDDSLTIRKCAYYLHINSVIRAGFVSIPKKNILNPESLVELFNIAETKD